MLALNFPQSWSSIRNRRWVVSGLGMQTPEPDAPSAGDFVARASKCCATPATRGNRAMQFQLFGRYRKSGRCEFDQSNGAAIASTKLAGSGSQLGSPYLSLTGGHLKLPDVKGYNSYTLEFWFRVDEENARDPVFTWMDIGGSACTNIPIVCQRPLTVLSRCPAHT